MAVPFLTSAAGSGIMGFLIRGIGSKLIVYAVVLWAWSSLIAFAISKVPSLDFNGIMGGLPDALIYGLYYVDYPYIMAAYISMETTAMLIRLRKG